MILKDRTIEEMLGCVGQPAEAGQQLAHGQGDGREPRALEPRVAGLGNGDTGQDIEDDPGRVGVEIGAVLEAPGGLGRVGDRSREHPLDQGALRLLGRHGPTLASARLQLEPRPTGSRPLRAQMPRRVRPVPPPHPSLGPAGGRVAPRPSHY